MKTITFVIPSLGNSEYLPSMLEFIKDNTNYNLVLVDNSYNKKLKALVNKEPKIHYIYENKSGVSHARNTGANIVQTDYIYFLDDDLSLDDSWLNRLNEILELDNRYDIIVGSIDVNNIPSEIPLKYHYFYGLKQFEDQLRILSRDYGGGANMIMTKEAFDLVGGFPVLLGHFGSQIGANEDTAIQDKIRSLGRKIYSDSRLKVIHNADIKNINVENKLKLQGKQDYIWDYQFSKKRYLLRKLKYTFMIFINRFYNTKSPAINFDIVRYKSYVKKGKERKFN